MGNVKRRPDGKYRARYRDHAGQEHAKHFDRKIDAERWVTGQEAALDRGEHVDPRAGRVRLADYAAAWLGNQVHLRDATRRQYEGALRLRIVPVLGDRPLATIRRSDVQSLVNAWAADGASAHSIANAYFKALRLVFKSAVLDGLIAKSPCVAIRRPQVIAKQIVPLTVDQVMAIAAEIEPRCKAGVLLGAGCGLRVGEIAGLPEPGIRWMTRQIAVTQQYARRAGGVRGGQIAPTKTRSSERVVPAPDFVLEALSGHIATTVLAATRSCSPRRTRPRGAPAWGAWGRPGETIPAPTLPHNARPSVRRRKATATILLAAAHSAPRSPGRSALSTRRQRSGNGTARPGAPRCRRCRPSRRTRARMTCATITPAC
jgi:integrase